MLIFKLKINNFGKLRFCVPYSFSLWVACRNLCPCDVGFVGIRGQWIPWVTGPVLFIYEFTKVNELSIQGRSSVCTYHEYMDGWMSCDGILLSHLLRQHFTLLFFSFSFVEMDITRYSSNYLHDRASHEFLITLFKYVNAYVIVFFQSVITLPIGWH